MEAFAQDPESATSIARREERPSIIVPAHRFKSEVRYTIITGDALPLPRLMLSVTHSLKLRWDAFIMLLAVWNCFYVPFAVAFLSKGESVALIITAVVIDMAYIADVVVSMRTTYIDLITGEEVTNSLRILKNYMGSGKLAVDILSAIPFDIVYLLHSNNEGLQLITLTKIVRLLRLSKILVFLRAKTHIKLTIKLAQLLFLFIIYLHLTACFWFLLIDSAQVYVPPALYIEHTNHEESLYYEGQILRQYAYSLYMAVYMLAGAEIGPRVEWERLFSGFAILLGQLFQAYMFGEIAVVLFELNKGNALIAEVQNAASTTMLHLKLKARLQVKISGFLRYSHSLARRQSEFVSFFGLLPPSLKQEVRAIIFEHVMLLNPALANHAPIQVSVLRHLKTLYCQPEEKIITQGEDATMLYFIVFGMCHVQVLDEHRSSKRMKSLGMGQHFGEIALLYPTPRTASVMAAGYVTLAMMSKDDFDYLSFQYPKFRTLFKVRAVHYHDDWKSFIKATLRRCALFAHLRGSILSQIIYRLPTTRVQPYTNLLREGDIADKITFVIDGNVEIYIPLNDELLMKDSQENIKKEKSAVTPFSPFNTRLKDHRATLAQIKKRKDMRFIVKMALEQLTMGSVLCPNLALLEDEHASFYAQTTETTIIMTLSKHLIQQLCQEFPEINNAITELRAQLMDVNYLSTVKRLQLRGLDYIRSFLTPVSHKDSLLWHAKMKVKRCAIGKILEKRQIRANGFRDVASLSHKLKGLILAEKQGDFEMAEKIRRGYLPTSADLIFPALQLLHLSEVTNPILTQFAMEAVKVSEVVIDRRDALVAMCGTLKRLDRLRGKTREKMREMDELAHSLGLLVRTLNSSRMAEITK